MVVEVFVITERFVFCYNCLLKVLSEGWKEGFFIGGVLVYKVAHELEPLHS